MGDNLMKLLLCKLGFHKWIYFPLYDPSINAKIITYFMLSRTCIRCRIRHVVLEQHFDPKTGVPIGKGE